MLGKSKRKRKGIHSKNASRRKNGIGGQTNAKVGKKPYIGQGK